VGALARCHEGADYKRAGRQLYACVLTKHKKGHPKVAFCAVSRKA